MRSISGFDRPFVQYLFVSIAVILVAVGAWGALSVRRASREIERLQEADRRDRIEREQLEARAAREQSARESLALQLSRARSGAPTDRPQAEIPTLTLSPLSQRGPAPPPPTVAPPPPSQVIALRLELPAVARQPPVSYQVAVRTWSGGRTVWSRAGLTSTGRTAGSGFLQTYITGDVFQPGSFEVLLAGTARDGTSTDVASYEVTVGR
jgi:hypothetical protein